MQHTTTPLLLPHPPPTAQPLCSASPIVSITSSKEAPPPSQRELAVLVSNPCLRPTLPVSARPSKAVAPSASRST
ncbi:hypothetical protein LINPERPRIM_LOCUS38840 [Linum perenne]